MLAAVFFLMFDSPVQIMLVIGVLALLFGAGRLPQLAKSLGQSRKAFKEGLREGEEDHAIDAAKITSGSTPKAGELSDAELEAELQKRADARAEH